LLRLCTNRAGPARPSMYGCAPLWASCAAAAALVQLAAGCIVIELNPSGFHANVNNLLALIPLVAHLHKRHRALPAQPLPLQVQVAAAPAQHKHRLEPPAPLHRGPPRQVGSWPSNLLHVAVDNFVDRAQEITSEALMLGLRLAGCPRFIRSCSSCACSFQLRLYHMLSLCSPHAGWCLGSAQLYWMWTCVTKAKLIDCTQVC